jgi:hypothetical protein
VGAKLIKNNMIEFFLGTVKERYTGDGISKEDFIILADIPGVAENVKAFPTKDNLDEPKRGDQVLLTSYDSFYHSYFTYRKLKENDFIGFRAAGKMIDITPEKITIGVFDNNNDSYADGERPDCSNYSSIEMDKDGNITIHAQKNLKIDIDGQTDLTVKGDCNVTSKGKLTLKGAPKIQMNTGKNGPLVNKKILNSIISAICGKVDALAAMLGVPPVLPEIEPVMNGILYDNNITH